MLWEELIETIANASGISVENAGILVACVITIAVVGMILALTGGKNADLPIIVSTIAVFVVSFIVGWIGPLPMIAMIGIVCLISAFYFSTIGKPGG